MLTRGRLLLEPLAFKRLCSASSHQKTRKVRVPFSKYTTASFLRCGSLDPGWSIAK
jgi:hypothetical protein